MPSLWTDRAGRTLAALAALALGAALLTTGCFAPRAETLARNWRPLGRSGPTLETALLRSPGRANIVWETYAGQKGAQVVRVTVEYDPAGTADFCPTAPAGMRRAVRAFFLLEVTVAPDRTVEFAAARAQAYSAKGAFAEYPLDAGVIADLVTRTFPLPCAALFLPNYL